MWSDVAEPADVYTYFRSLPPAETANHNHIIMPRAPPSSNLQMSEDTRPLLSAYNDHQSSDGKKEPTANDKSIITRSWQAASDAVRRYRSAPDLTSVIEKMEEWEKPDSRSAPFKVQLVCQPCQYFGHEADCAKMHSLYNYLSCYGPECWPTVPTQRIVETPMLSFILVSELDQSTPRLEKELKALRKFKEHWERDKYEAINYKKQIERRTERFNHDPVNQQLVKTFVSDVTKGVERCLEGRRAAREPLSEDRSSREHVSGPGSQVEGEINDSRDSLLQYSNPDTSDPLSIWSQA